MAIDILQFNDNDNYLLINNVNERSITHKLATYAEQTFGKDYDVDCEYNCNIGDKKEILTLKSKLEGVNNQTVIAEDDELIEKTVTVLQTLLFIKDENVKIIYSL